ncbi:MAG TPA: AMP-binding protein [Alphaproteobacteria bacterium]|nr:AMP-binding protein [Alphaproteobacteria bacterium]
MTADLLRSLAAQGGRAAVIQVQDESRHDTAAADLAALATRLAHGLIAEGVKPGEAVGLVGPNNVDWIAVRLALAAAGAITVACDDLGLPEDIAGFLHDSGCKLAFVSAAHAEHLKASGAAYQMVLLDGEGSENWRAWLKEPSGELPKSDPQAETMVVYTSGTTGKPKSFALTHANLAANVDALLAEKIVGEGDRVLLPLPLHHVFPLLVGMLTTLASGAALVLPEAVAGPQIAIALRVSKATVMVGVPRLFTALLAGIEAKAAARGGLAGFAYNRMLKLSLFARQKLNMSIGKMLFGPLHAQLGGHLRLMASGGAKLEAPAMWRLEALGWQVLSGYGLAETASMFTANLPGRQRVGSEGRPIGGGQVRVAKLAEGDEDAPDMGEIQLKGASVFKGYRDNPDANATAFTPDGWFRTGDLGHVDADGYVYITGRAKEMIVLGGGKNVYPEETEKHYAASSYIRELAVLERDGKLVALVLPDPVAIRAAGLTRLEDAVRVALAERAQTLPSYQRIAGYALVREPLPRTRLGKYRRFLLPKLYDDAKAGLAKPKAAEMSVEDQALIGASPAREAWEILRARYADRGVTLDANMSLDLGIDSLEWMTLGLELESRLGLEVSEAALQHVNTVRDLLTVLAKAKPANGEGGDSADVKAAADKWLAPTGPSLSALGWLLYWVNRLGLKAMFRISATGLENVPVDGPVMIVANHVSDIDPPVLAGVMPYRRMRRLFWSGDVGRLFETLVGRKFARATHIFPVDERSPKATLAMGKEVLKRGNGLVWFPEAWRSPDGELQRFLPGAGLVLADQPVTVVPAYIDGAYEALPRHRHSPKFVKVTVHFGGAISAEDIKALAGAGGNEGAQRIVAHLQGRVAALKP